MITRYHDLSLSVLAVSATLCLLMGGNAYAQSPLPPGTTSGIPVPIISAGSPIFGGTLLEEATAPLFGTNILNTISGTVSSAVFRSPSGFLDFAYQFSFLPSTNVVLDSISLSSFTNVTGVAVAHSRLD